MFHNLKIYYSESNLLQHDYVKCKFRNTDTKQLKANAWKGTTSLSFYKQYNTMQRHFNITSKHTTNNPVKILLFLVLITVANKLSQFFCYMMCTKLNDVQHKIRAIQKFIFQ